MTDKRKYIARPVSPVTRRVLCGTHGILTGEYVSTDNALRFMIEARGTKFNLYNLYRDDFGGPNWTLIGTYRA